MKILLGMSGGIDSTYAALKLLDEGHEVTGAVLVMHEYTDIACAERAAIRVGIPMVKVDCREAFEREIKEYFVREYCRARTPNPCIVCNSEVKFRFLYEYAVANGFDAIATGHYARVVQRKTGDGERYAVAKATDLSKDQTYMLYRLPQHILKMLVLPLADLFKNDVKRLATAAGIDEQGQEESQEICFIPDGDYRTYVVQRTKEPEGGSFIDDSGRIIGAHKGIISYTVGQRKGLGISLGERAFVTNINAETNEITVSTSVPVRKTVTVSSIVYSGLSKPDVGTTLLSSVKIRYGKAEQSAVIRILEDARAEIEFDTPARLVSAGQSAVVYDGDTVLFGGFID